MVRFKIFMCLFLLVAGALGNSPITYASGQLWMEMFSPTTAHLFDVCMVNATDGWIVGNGGMILHWNGVEWSQVSSPTTADLRAVYMHNSTEGWAVGLSGAIIHWNGVEWTIVSSGVTKNLLDIAGTFLGPSYYVVGVDGTLLWWNKTAEEWQPQSVPTSEDLRGITMAHYMIWIPFPPPGHLEIVRDGWAVGNGGTILRWDGSWSSVTSPTAAQLNDVCRISSNDAWAVGANWIMLHWNGAEWSIVSTPKSGYGYFNAIDMVSATDGWAMGYGGTIIHWDGTAWSEVSSPTTNVLNAVCMINATDGWAVGLSGTIIRWTTSGWVPEINMALFMPLLISLTLTTVVIAKTLTKKHRSE